MSKSGFDDKTHGRGRKSRGFRLAFIGLSALSAAGAQAATVTLDSSTFGIYESFGAFSHTTPSSLIRYDVGSPADAVTIRHYFVFNLAGISDNITGATLQIFAPSAPRSPNASDHYKVSAITTDIATLIDPNTVGDAILFEDLNDGTLYGETDLEAANIVADTKIEIDLTGAVVDLNAKRGGMIAVGGSIDPLVKVTDPGTGDILTPYYFSGAQNSANPAPQLVLTTTPVPLPAAWLLFLTGCPLLMRFVTRERAQLSAATAFPVADTARGPTHRR